MERPMLILTSVILSCALNGMANVEDRFAATYFDLVRETPGNFFYSPLSVKTLLGLATLGADRNSAAQLVAVTGRPATINGKSVKNFFDSIENVTLQIANGLFVDKKFFLKPGFEKNIKKEFKADTGRLDFSRSSEATKKINAWVAGKTNKKISQILDDGVLNSASKLVLLNAIYFKGDWQEKFDRDDTESGLFYLPGNGTKKVEFMKIPTELRVLDSASMQVVELPYEGGEVAMVLVIPKARDILDKIEKEISPNLNLRFLKDQPKRDVILKMPKFKLQQTLKIKEILQKMGITDIFIPGAADFSKMSNEPLYISEAIQKSVIEVNEEGSEAASASGFSISFRMMDTEPPLKIVADSPFLFFVQARGQTIFVGRVSDPTN